MGVKLRSTGMPLTDIHRYVELIRHNSDTRKARLLNHPGKSRDSTS